MGLGLQKKIKILSFILLFFKFCPLNLLLFFFFNLAHQILNAGSALRSVSNISL
jgi:hypothetical protein